MRSFHIFASTFFLIFFLFSPIALGVGFALLIYGIFFDFLQGADKDLKFIRIGNALHKALPLFRDFFFTLIFFQELNDKSFGHFDVQVGGLGLFLNKGASGTFQNLINFLEVSVEGEGLGHFLLGRAFELNEGRFTRVKKLRLV